MPWGVQTAEMAPAYLVADVVRSRLFALPPRRWLDLDDLPAACCRNSLGLWKQLPPSLIPVALHSALARSTCMPLLTAHAIAVAVAS
jgi:hypothetical protein